ncbi:MAG: hypothetical protein ACLFUB_16325 [Cyclobacteriaceae bacterium]
MLEYHIGFSHKVGMNEVVPDLVEIPSGPSRTALLYTDEKKNILGPSLDLGLELKIVPWNTSFAYRMGFRYDHLYHFREINSNFIESVNGLFYEHHFSVHQYMGRGRFKALVTTGLSLLNRGASYQVLQEYDIPEDFNLQTSAFNVGFGFRLDQFTATFRNHFISGNNNPFSITTNYGLVASTKGFSVQEISLHYTFK